MIKNPLIRIFKESFYRLFKNPLLIFPSLFLYISLIFLSNLSVRINYKLQTTPLLTGWVVLFSIASLLITSFFLSGLIGASFQAMKGKIRLKDMLKYSKKFCLPNLAITFIIIALYNIIRYLAHNIPLLILKPFNIPLSIAQGVFFILYFAGLVGIIIFLTFSNFYLIIKDVTILEAIKKSISLVKENYLNVLSIMIIFFVINELLNLANTKLLYELVNAIFVVPYLSLILTKFLLDFDEK
ncbi:MAG: hypothetical protein AABX83_03910 [Nanoarchaeota archaeon]